MNSNVDLSELELPEKEKRILEAAIQISNEKGFSSTTTSEIAKRAGIAEGTIFRYFKTKKDIMHGILLQAVKIAADKVVLTSLGKIFKNEDQKDLRTILKDILIDRLELVQKFFPMFRVILSEALFHEDIREVMYNNLFTKMEQQILAFYKKMAESGQIRTDIEPMTIMRNIIGSFFAFIGQKMLFTDNFKLSENEKEIDDMISLLIDGISPQKQQ
ncbi:MAG: transcriptional regulator, TetR family [Eubacterium sp.]|jgi:AcrR family transcriptional regulator|nr:transcriptional regulator, TetR family [Eubacterium sp.]